MGEFQKLALVGKIDLIERQHRLAVRSLQIGDDPVVVRLAARLTRLHRIDDEQKTVAKGALWYEESLPAESILAGLVWCDRVFGLKNNGGSPITQFELLDQFCPTVADKDNSILQIGGKATVGKGRVRCAFTSSGKNGGQL